MAATKSKTLTVELSRMVDTSHWKGKPLNIRVEASEEERRLLAARFDLEDIVSLWGEASLDCIEDDDEFRLRGKLVAEVVQACVVTLNPIRTSVNESFERRFSAAAVPADDGLVNLDAEDPPDPLIGGKIDVGEVLAEELGLALDPYPRLPGASLDMAAAGEPEEPSPFERLRALRDETADQENASPSPAAQRRPTRN
jgi:uncharacterized metal-binding protein YceD (DUF177 family)